MLLKLPADLISHVAGFLAPCDFYNTKTAVSSGLTTVQRDHLNCIYWWRDEVPLQRAVLARCPTLVRWVVRCDREMDPDEVVAACDSATADVRVALHSAMTSRWPAHLQDMLGRWVDMSDTAMFKYQIVRQPRTATADVFDLMYTHERWLMLAMAFRYAPREFITWAFGNYREAADAELIANMRFVIRHLDQVDRAVFTNILRKYHEWLWNYKLDRVATLQTIASLHSLEHVIQFDSARYFQLAIRSPIHDFLEYLLMRGLDVEPVMLQQTHDLKKLRLMMTAQFVQKYQRIVLMILVLASAVVLNIFTRPVVVVPPTRPDPVLIGGR